MRKRWRLLTGSTKLWQKIQNANICCPWTLTTKASLPPSVMASCYGNTHMLLYFYLWEDLHNYNAIPSSSPSPNPNHLNNPKLEPIFTSTLSLNPQTGLWRCKMCSLLLVGCIFRYSLPACRRTHTHILFFIIIVTLMILSYVLYWFPHKLYCIL